MGFERRAGGQHKPVVARPTNELIRRGEPSSASPAGSASAGKPSALKGYVNLISESRMASSSTTAGGGTKPSVGASSRSKLSNAFSARSRYHRSIFIRTFMP